MAESLDAYSVQHWMESAPQGYLLESEFGHHPGEKEPDFLLESPLLREQAIRVTAQLVLAERCSLAASAGLVYAAPDEATQRFLATQTLDEARHVEVFTQRLYDLGVERADLESTLRDLGDPHLAKFAEILLERVHAGDFVAGVVGQNVILEGMAFHVLEMMHAVNRGSNDKFARTLAGAIADERRHVGFGDRRIGELVREHPERKAAIERLQCEMSYHMVASFGAAFGAGPSAAQLGDTVLADFKQRLEHIGLEYRVPRQPG